MPLSQRPTRTPAPQLLLVTGNPHLQARLLTLLREAGLEVRSAAGLAEAAHLALAEDRPHPWRPDLFLVDWHLSDGHAVELLYYVRTEPRLLGIPLMLLGQKNSLYDWEGFIQRQPFPPDAWLMKPFNPPDLMDQVHRLLEAAIPTQDRSR